MADEVALCPADVVKLATSVRKQHHPDLKDAIFAYVFVPKAPVRRGKLTLGTASKAGKVLQLLAKVDFVISLARDRWEELTPEQRKALLDHEFSHCAPKTNPKGDRVGWQTVGHDVEEFCAVLERWGLWHRDVERFARVTLVQLGLPFPEEVAAQ